MGFHHTAFATRDANATHDFYTKAMGFELVKIVAAPTPEGGWAKHLFYETGKDEYIAFCDLHARRDRWLDYGIVVSEVDHGWCHSIYTVDPNGILVEFCTTTRALTAADREEAERLLANPAPPLQAVPEVVVHQPAAGRQKAAAGA